MGRRPSGTPYISVMPLSSSGQHGVGSHRQELSIVAVSTRTRFFRPCGSSGRARYVRSCCVWRDLMELLHERCAALDIGKKDLKACVRTPSPSG